MNISFPKFQIQIPWQKIFEKWFFVFFSIFFIASIAWGFFVFYFVSGASLVEEEVFTSFQIKDLKTIEALLDQRANALNLLRKTKPSIKNPF